jgi:hypothetical protein
MALQPRIIACGNKVATFSMMVRFLTGPAIMAAASIAVGLRGTLLRVAIVQVKPDEGKHTHSTRPTTPTNTRTSMPLTRTLLWTKKETERRSSGRPGMPIYMPPAPEKRGKPRFHFILCTHKTLALLFFITLL